MQTALSLLTQSPEPPVAPPVRHPAITVASHPPLFHRPLDGSTPGLPEDDPFAVPVALEMCNLQAVTLPPWASKFLVIPCPLASSQIALFEPGLLAEGLMAVASVSKGRHLTLAITNLFPHPSYPFSPLEGREKTTKFRGD